MRFNSGPDRIYASYDSESMARPAIPCFTTCSNAWIPNSELCFIRLSIINKQLNPTIVPLALIPCNLSNHMISDIRCNVLFLWIIFRSSWGRIRILDGTSSDILLWICESHQFMNFWIYLWQWACCFTAIPPPSARTWLARASVFDMLCMLWGPLAKTNVGPRSIKLVIDIRKLDQTLLKSHGLLTLVGCFRSQSFKISHRNCKLLPKHYQLHKPHPTIYQHIANFCVPPARDNLLSYDHD